MAGYDAWLEAPYQQRAAYEGALEQFAEANDIDFDDPDLERLFEEAREAWEEEAAERRAEARAERDDW